MNRIRVDVRDAAAAAPGGFAAPNQAVALVPFAAPSVAVVGVGQVPAAVALPGGPAHAVVSATTPSLGGWPSLRGVARIVRNAAIAVAVMALLPIGLVVVRGNDMSRLLYGTTRNTDSRVQAAQGVRAFRVSTDASISPMQAGLALNALQSPRGTSADYPMIDPGARPVAMWRSTPVPADLFLTARPDFSASPSSRHILEAAAHGLNARELAYLRGLATAPVWRDFDIVARAPAVDIIGGQFRTPFPANARPEQRPTLQFVQLRDLAYASVSRAAYHVAMDQPDSAEAALRSVVSLGFTLIDNGSTTMDALIGTIMVGIGRDALQRLYTIEHDPRATAPALAPPKRSGAVASIEPAATSLTADEMRHRLLGRIEDPALPRGERFEALERASAALSCTNPRELLFGPRADLRGVLARAPQTLARYPSERALIELETRPLVLTGYYPSAGLISSTAMSVASVAGIVLNNPRLPQCTAMLMGNW